VEDPPRRDRAGVERFFPSSLPARPREVLVLQGLGLARPRQGLDELARQIELAPVELHPLVRAADLVPAADLVGAVERLQPDDPVDDAQGRDVLLLARAESPEVVGIEGGGQEPGGRAGGRDPGSGSCSLSVVAGR